MKEKYNNHNKRIDALNKNYKAFLIMGRQSGDIVKSNAGILHDVYGCMQTGNYNAFSNTTSAGNYLTQPLPVSLEQPHNSVHLAIGGITNTVKWNCETRRFEEIKYEYGIEKGANGDMGENETAAFDPIFFFHHANIGK